MKSVLISIQPKWVDKIASGEKTIEVRKTRPKLETPFKCYIYQTKKFVAVDITDGANKYRPFLRQNQDKVIGEFVCDRIDNYECELWNDEAYELIRQFDYDEYGEIEYKHGAGNNENCEMLNKACLTWQDIRKYLGQGLNNCYAWHIYDLKIYDKPKELSEFIKPFKYDGDGLRCCAKEELEDIYEWDCETLFKNKYPNFDFENCKCEDCPKAKDFYRLTRPPQSWCYVEEL